MVVAITAALSCIAIPKQGRSRVRFVVDSSSILKEQLDKWLRQAKFYVFLFFPILEILGDLNEIRRSL